MRSFLKFALLAGCIALAAPAFAENKPEAAPPSAAPEAGAKVVATAEATAAEVAAPAAPQFVAPVADLASAEAGSYKIDPGHTNVFFRLAHLGFSGYMGRFDKIEGMLELDPKALDKTKLEVTIDPAGVNTNNAKLEGELRSSAFEVEKFSAITFKSVKMVQKDASHGEVTGDLTLHGVTKPVTLNVTLNGVGVHPMSKAQVLGFSAIGAIKRSDFGIVNWLPMVGDDVQIIIEAELQKE